MLKVVFKKKKQLLCWCFTPVAHEEMTVNGEKG